MVTGPFKNFAVRRDATRRAGLSATAELLVLTIIARYTQLNNAKTLMLQSLKYVESITKYICEIGPTHHIFPQVSTRHNGTSTLINIRTA